MFGNNYIYIHICYAYIGWWNNLQPPPKKTCIGFTNTHKIHGTGIYKLHEKPIIR